MIATFRDALPDATIYVYDNNSTDRTREVAAAAGAVVRNESLQGKGNVVRRMFADIEADGYVLVDGDDTYEAAAAPAMVTLLMAERLDMVTAVRVTDADAGLAYRPGHRFGNRVLTGMVRWIFGDRVSDMLSGYRVFSRRFVKSFPALASGFETEFTVHALELRLPLGDVRTRYQERPVGSVSKLNTWRDGMRILRTILRLVQRERPVAFFAGCGGVFMLVAVLLALPLVATYIETGLVPRFPTAVLATGLGILSMLSLVCGLILDTVSRGQLEARVLAYSRDPRTGAGYRHSLTREPRRRRPRGRGHGAFRSLQRIGSAGIVVRSDVSVRWRSALGPQDAVLAQEAEQRQ